MITDLQLTKTLNLPRTSPAFAYRQRADGSLDVVQPSLIPNDDSTYWVAGRTILANREELASVFIIESGGGNIVGVYWFVNNGWYKSDDPDAPGALGIPKESIFPFDWQYAIPVENDIYHQ